MTPDPGPSLAQPRTLSGRGFPGRTCANMFRPPGSGRSAAAAYYNYKFHVRGTVMGQRLEAPVEGTLRETAEVYIDGRWVRVVITAETFDRHAAARDVQTQTYRSGEWVPA